MLYVRALVKGCGHGLYTLACVMYSLCLLQIKVPCDWDLERLIHDTSTKINLAGGLLPFALPVNKLLIVLLFD